MNHTKTHSQKVIITLALTALTLVATQRLHAAAGDVLVSGGNWDGGRGVNVIDNGGNPANDWGGNYLNGVYCGEKWQCVELAQRHYMTRGYRSSSFPVNYAYEIYDVAGSMGMTAHPNGDGYVPEPGDMVIWAANSSGSGVAGHVAVVDWYDSGHVYVCEQNFSSTGRATLNRSGTSGSFLTRSDGWGTIRGVVHSPHCVNITVDNSSGGFSASANWVTGTGATDKFGSDYRYRSTQAISDAATFSTSLPEAGSYTVYVWYPQGSNRSSTTPYVISTTAGTSTVNVNQQITGGQWVSQGAFSMNAGANTVKVSCWTTTGFVVMADAVKWAK